MVVLLVVVLLVIELMADLDMGNLAEAYPADRMAPVVVGSEGRTARTAADSVGEDLADGQAARATVASVAKAAVASVVEDREVLEPPAAAAAELAKVSLRATEVGTGSSSSATKSLRGASSTRNIPRPGSRPP